MAGKYRLMANRRLTRRRVRRVDNIAAKPSDDSVCYLPSSRLPEALKAAGYNVVSVGQAERVLPATETVRINARSTVKRDALKSMQIAIYQFELQ